MPPRRPARRGDHGEHQPGVLAAPPRHRVGEQRGRHRQRGGDQQQLHRRPPAAGSTGGGPPGRRAGGPRRSSGSDRDGEQPPGRRRAGRRTSRRPGAGRRPRRSASAGASIAAAQVGRPAADRTGGPAEEEPLRQRPAQRGERGRREVDQLQVAVPAGAGEVSQPPLPARPVGDRRRAAGTAASVSETPATSTSERCGRAASTRASCGVGRRPPGRAGPPGPSPPTVPRSTMLSTHEPSSGARVGGQRGRVPVDPAERAGGGHRRARADGHRAAHRLGQRARAPRPRAAAPGCAGPRSPGRAGCAPMPSGCSTRHVRRGGQPSPARPAAGPGGVVARAEGQPAVDRAGRPVRRAHRQRADRALLGHPPQRRGGLRVDVVPAQPGHARRPPRSRRCARRRRSPGGRPARRRRAATTTRVSRSGASRRSISRRPVDGAPRRRRRPAASAAAPRRAPRSAATVSASVGPGRGPGRRRARPGRPGRPGRRAARARPRRPRPRRPAGPARAASPTSSGRPPTAVATSGYAGPQRLLGEQLPGLPVAGDHGEVGRRRAGRPRRCGARAGSPARRAAEIRAASCR